MADHAHITPEAVDDVARRMTEGNVPADLRARVLNQLATSRPTSWQRGTLINSGIAASVAALLVAGVIWSHRVAPLPVPSTIASNVSAPAIAPKQPPKAAEIPRRTSRPRRQQVVLPGLRVLDAPAPIALDAIQPERLSIPQLTVAPLVTEPLRSTPADGGGSER